MKLTDEQLSTVAEMREQGHFDNYIAWAIGCNVADLPLKKPRRRIEQNECTTTAPNATLQTHKRMQAKKGKTIE